MKYGRFITINLSEPSDFSHTKKNCFRKLRIVYFLPRQITLQRLDTLWVPLSIVRLDRVQGNLVVHRSFSQPWKKDV